VYVGWISGLHNYYCQARRVIIDIHKRIVQGGQKLSKQHGRLRFVTRALTDLVGIFAPLKTYNVPTRPNGKRILIFNWRDSRHTYAGGAEVYIEQLAQRWVKQGNHVTLFCGSDGRGAPRHEVKDGIVVIRRGGTYFVYVWAFIYYMLRMRGKYDIIVDCHNGIPFFAPFFARVPVICIVHHIHQDVFKQHLSKNMARFACWLENTLMPRAYKYSQYVAVSPSTKREMEELGLKSTKDIEIVYNGVDLANLKPGKKTSHPSVIFMGRLQPYKSVDVLVRAFQDVRKDHPTAKLTIAGGGDALESLKAQAKDLQLDKHVTFTGKISEAKKREIFQNAWVMANPSMKEGWGITTIEANACATPVVGANVPGLRDSIVHGKTGALVPYGNHYELGRQLSWLLSDHGAREAMAKHAHEWAQKFHWDNSADQMFTIIEQELGLAQLQPEEVANA
jgi:glycosyltransferase involved in cell wall biosynthesis